MRPLVSIKYWPSQPRKHKWIVAYRQGEERRLRYFVDEKSAKSFAREKEIELLNEGRRNGEITSEERQAIMVAREKGFTVKTAVDHYALHVASLGRSTAIENAVEEFLSSGKARLKVPCI